MSNYTKTTNFAAKDALSSGDPSKLVNGTEIDNEFNAIATAVATKANSSDVPSLSGANNFTGGQQTLSGVQPVLAWNETDAAADSKYWKAFADGGIWKLIVQTDAQAGSATAIAVTRSANTIANITLTTSLGTWTLSGTTLSQTDGTTTGVLGFAATAFAFGTSSAHNATIQTNGTTRITVRQDGTFVQQNLTVATLPAAGTAGAGARAFVTDANATTFASVVAGGGANKLPVYSDGTNWRIG